MLARRQNDTALRDVAGQPLLASKASAAEFDTSFNAGQVLELAADATNIALLGLNMRDGLKMKGWLRRQPA